MNTRKTNTHMIVTKKWPHGGSSQSVAQLLRRATTMKLTGTDRQTGGQAGKPMFWKAVPPKNIPISIREFF